MIISALKFVSTGLKFLLGNKKVLLIGAVAAAGLLVSNTIENHGEMKATIKHLKTLNQYHELDVAVYQQQLSLKNAQLQRMNQQVLAEAAEARRILATADRLVEEFQEEVEDVQVHRRTTRDNTLEAIQNDESMADWADNPVPAVAWSLLQQAAEGGAR